MAVRALLDQVLPPGDAELPFELVVALSTQQGWAATSASALREGQVFVVLSSRYAQTGWGLEPIGGANLSIWFVWCGRKGWFRPA